MAASGTGPGRPWRPAAVSGMEHILEGPSMGHCTSPVVIDLWLMERDGWMVEMKFSLPNCNLPQKVLSLLTFTPS